MLFCRNGLVEEGDIWTAEDWIDIPWVRLEQPPGRICRYMQCYSQLWSMLFHSVEISNKLHQRKVSQACDLCLPVTKISALVETWLPGIEGNLFMDAGIQGLDFSGQLPVLWSRKVMQPPSDTKASSYHALFPLGFRLGYGREERSTDALSIVVTQTS